MLRRSRPGRAGLLVTLLLGLAPACGGGETSAPAGPDRSPAAAAPDASPPTGPASMPFAALERPTHAQYEATVVACLSAGQYSYLELALADGERRWAVIASERPAIGAAVRTRVYGTQQNFDSRRLKRRFDRLDFAAIEPI